MDRPVDKDPKCPYHSPYRAMPPPEPTDAPRYHPFYCEENIWWLSVDPAFVTSDRRVVFISNPARCCLLAEQRAGGQVVWDYHVLLLVEAAGWWALDPNSLLDLPVALGTYLDQTFPPQIGLADRFAPSFRVIRADDFVATFTTDRSHMRRRDGTWLQPPPSWEPPTAAGHPHNLERFIDFTDDIAGEVFDMAQLRARYCR